jgi:hypothetical protein
MIRVERTAVSEKRSPPPTLLCLRSTPASRAQPEAFLVADHLPRDPYSSYIPEVLEPVEAVTLFRCQ